ncbi:glycoside hydrolase family 3 protein [Babjeviella inositovora NRRL Y-12698]|uniref:beta-glucosidase n=1 Tax=Babjeviella inositovora NRRL Y-12698 TaxID=984486 RepID=A0A1E3QS79_9ASCO|nr:glycoside hydrolase family 3 protein [Babjeviella inositovora NRRL Y-12698]ODQ79882.1 glycoside hydrolase family 3 protein [Babjeviella inositovora NRRL Y-12698]
MSTFDIETTISQLTLDEKVKLMAGADFWHTQAIERLSVPLIRVSDGPNGVRGTKFFNGVPAACFPCGTGLASTFDKELMHEAGKLMALEAKHKGAHVILGPTCNMQRSPLGGRGFESFSEDPVLSGLSSASIILGMQSENIGATIKHYVCNDIEVERNSINSVVTQRALREIYLMPFQLAMRDADPKALMTAYNKVNGEHASQSKFLLHDILRDEWKWDGMVMSDWFGCYSLKEAVDAGLDLEMPGKPMIRVPKSMAHAVQTKEIHMNTIDDRVRSVLKLVQWCQKSGIPENAPEDADNNTPKTTAQLRTLAADSIVLLKNENSILPLKPSDSIAVIGPNAKVSANSGGGSASLLPYHTITPYEGICKRHGKDVPYTIGATANKMLPALGPQLTRDDGSVGFVGNFYLEPRGTEGRTKIDSFNLSSSFIFLVDYMHEKFESKLYVDFEGIFTPEVTGEHVFGAAVFGDAQIFVDDKLVVDNKTKHTSGDFFFAQGTIEEKGRISLEKGKPYRVRVELGSPVTSQHYKGIDTSIAGAGGIQFGAMAVLDARTEITKAVELAKSVDKVVLVTGLTQEWESEGYDRANMKLPGLTDELVAAVVKVNPNVVVVNQSGTPVEFPWLDQVPGLVQAWFGGNELGNGIADVLYGDVNPSGKLSLSWPKRVEDNPAYFNFKSNKGQVLYGEDIYVGYKYYEKLNRPALFPFGFGLSYTKFEFSNLKVGQDEKNFNVSVEVKNTGDKAGSTVAQVYVGAVDSSVERPIKELREFSKVKLQSGETKTVRITLPIKYATAFFDEYEGKWNCEKGEYLISVGDSSDNTTVKQSVTLEKGFLWSGL